MEDSTDSPLIMLPPEIRNEIYRHCLVINEGRIMIDKQLKPPALLSVCRQIRQEATALWYLGNGFTIKLRSCDASLYRAWMSTIVKPLSLKTNFEDNLILGINHYHINWKNLVDWCGAGWSGELSAVDMMQHGTPATVVIQAATNIASRARTMEWEKVVGPLEGLRLVAGQVTDLQVDAARD